MSVLVQIADAVAASINSGTYSESVIAQRSYRPSFDLEQLAETRVTVVPRSEIIETMSRLHSRVDCKVDVGIQQRVPAGDEPRIDALLDLAEEIGDQLRHKGLEDFPEAVWISIEHDPVAASEHLDELSTLTTVLSVTYRVRR